MNLSIFSRWDVITMCTALAVVFVFEMLGVFTPAMSQLPH